MAVADCWVPDGKARLRKVLSKEASFLQEFSKICELIDKAS